MNFRKYPSIENSYRDIHINNWLKYAPELQVEEYIITEKIHGSNFQILIDKDGVKFASRNMLLQEGDSFFGFQDVMAKYKDMIDTFLNMIDKKTQSIRIFGELFGSNIQKGVDYGREKQFKIFDIYINEELLTQFDTLTLLEAFGLKDNFVPVLAIVKGLDRALEFNTEFNTTLFDKTEDNICEGVVIKPYKKVYCYEGKSPFYLKKKNTSFTEKQKSKGTGRDTPNSQFVKVQCLFEEYLSENRVNNIFSKQGVIDNPKKMGEYIKLVTEDAKEDFLKDNMEEFNLLQDKEKRGIFSISGRIIVPILQKYL